MVWIRQNVTMVNSEAETSSSFLDEVQLTTVIVRVRDIAKSVEWYRGMLGWEPVHQGADGKTPPYAVYSVCGVIVTMWQLTEGDVRNADESDRNSYMILVFAGDLDALWHQLTERGVRADRPRNSANNRFFWLYDPDHNRWEVSQPTTKEQRDAAAEVMGLS